MVQQTQTSKQALPAKLAHPRRRDIFFHFFKTSKLVGALFTDRRVPVAHKIGFFAVIAALAGLLIFPDFLDETVLSVVMPVVGTVLGVPIDAGFDWGVFALVAVGLLKIFPAEIVGEHYRRIFHGL